LGLRSSQHSSRPMRFFRAPKRPKSSVVNLSEK
jgi:hypothetical protein